MKILVSLLLMVLVVGCGEEKKESSAEDMLKTSAEEARKTIAELRK